MRCNSVDHFLPIAGEDTPCPHCGEELCWYRTPNTLYAICPIHQVVHLLKYAEPGRTSQRGLSRLPEAVTGIVFALITALSAYGITELMLTEGLASLLP